MIRRPGLAPALLLAAPLLALWGFGGLQTPARRATAADVPLLRAVERRDVRAAARAIDAGASPNAFVVDQETVLMRAAATGSTDMVRLLVRRGADVNRVSFLGFTVLDAARWRDRKTDLRMLRLLLSLGAKPGEATLWEYVDSPEATRLLLAAHAPFGRAAVSEAIERNRLDTLRLLVDARAPVDAEGRGGYPLQLAAANGRLEAARLLLAHGARRDLRDAEGHTATEVALRTGHDDVAVLLGAKPPSLPPLLAPELTKVARSFASGLAHVHDYAWRPNGDLVVWRPVVTGRMIDETKSVLLAYDRTGRRLSTRAADYPLSDASLSPDGARLVWSDDGIIHDVRPDGLDAAAHKASEYVRVFWTQDSSGWVALGWNTSNGEYDRVFWRDGRAEPLSLKTGVRPLGDEIDPTWVHDREHVRTVTYVRGSRGAQNRTCGTLLATALTPDARPTILGQFDAPRGGAIEEAAFSPDGERVAWIVTLPRDHRVGVWTSRADGGDVRCVGTMIERSPPSYGVHRDVWIGWRLAEQPHHLRWTPDGRLSFVVRDALWVAPSPATVR